MSTPAPPTAHTASLLALASELADVVVALDTGYSDEVDHSAVVCAGALARQFLHLRDGEVRD